MTHEQIESAIERLRELGGDGCITNADIIDAVFSGNNFKVRDALIALLKQADPDTHMKVPVDADGVPIHMGDRMVLTVCTTDELPKAEEKVVTVEAVDETGYYYRNRSSNDARPWRACGSVSHHHKPTVEDVLCEMLEKAVGFSDAHTTVALNAVAEYADKLRELMADDDAR